MSGKVWLVGAGPGDSGLFTLKGLEVLQGADVVVYDALIGVELMALIPEQAVKIDVGKRASNHRMPQERINKVLLEQAQAGRKVVRLKGGDPFLFGRGGEELELLVENHIPYEIVPGVTSAFAVPAYNGIPVTHRDYTSSVHVITGHRRADRGQGGGSSLSCLDIDFEALARTQGTLIFLMGLSNLPVIMKGLMDAGLDPGTPAAVLEKGTTAEQRRVIATVETLETESKLAGIQAPAIIVVGQVCKLAESFAWAEKRPLGGKKILLTRPKELISEMAARLRRLGAEVVEVPAIDTVPIEPNPALDECMDRFSGTTCRVQPAGTNSICQNAEAVAGEAAEAAAVTGCCAQPAEPAQDSRHSPDWLVFTSPTGVGVFMDRFLRDHDIRDLWGTRIASIGAGSSRKLKQYGIKPDFVPSVFDGETLGRELAAKIIREKNFCEKDVPEESARKEIIREEIHAVSVGKNCGPEGKTAPVRILIPRAAIGNPELIEELKKIGNVEILDVPTYNTEYRSSGIVDVKGLLREGRIDYAVFTSASTVRGFRAQTEGMDLSGLKAVCIGRQTRAAADGLGMDTRMAEKATLDALVDAVVACAAEDPAGDE